MNSFLIAEIVGDNAYLWYGSTYLGCMSNWTWQELASRKYLIVWK